MIGRWQFLLDVWLIWMGAGFVHILLVWLALRRCDLQAPEFKVFYGKPLFAFPFRGTVFALGWIPLGMYVKWDEEEFPAAPWRYRAGIPLVGPIAIALVSLLLLGWSPWVAQVMRSFRQFFDATIHPLAVGVPLLEQFYAANLALTTFIGVILAKNAVFSLIPLPTLPGGALWSEALRRPEKNEPLELIQTVGALACIACQVSWAIAWWHFLRKS
jgi:membrane-associated protease RseP (regulator of RpoE activity)